MNTIEATRRRPSIHPRLSTLQSSLLTGWENGLRAPSVGDPSTASSREREIWFPDSLGLFYSAFTFYCGFAVNDGEYKLMGLAPFGEPRYERVLRDRVIHVAEDGSIHLDQRWFDFRAGNRMTHPRLARLLDGPPRTPDEPLTAREADIACSIQRILEDSVLKMAHHAFELTGERSVALAGGVALNCVANSRLMEDGPFDEVWVQPAAGDDGSALGAALWAWHNLDDQPRKARTGDGMGNARLGPAFSDDEIARWLVDQGIPFTSEPDLDRLCGTVARALSSGLVVGWFRGRMEFGPRALGSRSILADPRKPEVVDRLNRTVKDREDFRPFAPAVLAEMTTEWFDLGKPSPYMLLTARVRSAGDVERPAEHDVGSFPEILGRSRSDIPACTHVDGSARVQTVAQSDDSDFHRLLTAFYRQTGCPVVLNTSFNRSGEPIVCTPEDALGASREAGLDLLVLENCLVERAAVGHPQGSGLAASRVVRRA